MCLRDTDRNPWELYRFSLLFPKFTFIRTRTGSGLVFLREFPLKCGKYVTVKHYFPPKLLQIYHSQAISDSLPVGATDMSEGGGHVSLN